MRRIALDVEGTPSGKKVQYILKRKKKRNERNVYNIQDLISWIHVIDILNLAFQKVNLSALALVLPVAILLGCRLILLDPFLLCKVLFLHFVVSSQSEDVELLLLRGEGDS